MHYLPAVRLEHGGVTRAVLDFCRVFASRGRQVTLVTSDPTDVPAPWLAGGAGVPKVVIQSPCKAMGLLSRDSAAGLPDLLGGADVLHLHGPWTLSNVQFASAAQRLGIPYVISPHGMLDTWSMAQKWLKKRIYLMLVGSRLLKGAAAVHCTAEAELEQASEWFDRDKGIVLPYLFDLEPFVRLPEAQQARSRFPGLDSDRPVLLFLSRVHPKKGVEQLLRAAAVLRKRGISCEVLIAGPGEKDYVARLASLASAEGLREQVHFLGMVRGEEKLSLYRNADLFVLPTSQENFGLVLLESLACGTPIVTTRGVDIWKELEKGGASIADANPEELAGVIADLLADRETLKSRGSSGRKWVFECYDPQKLAIQYDAFYDDVVRAAAGK
jgi:glycosyltransferase involved in cell wall biosynthesis